MGKGRGSTLSGRSDDSLTTSQLKGTTVSDVRDLHEQWLQTPEYQAAYQELGPEFELVRLLIEIRIKADLTQAQSERTA